MNLKTELKTSAIVEKVCENYTIEYNKEYSFELHNIDKSVLPEKWGIGLIVGSSGSGKSLLLKEFQQVVPEPLQWDRNDAVCSHFDSYEDAEKRLMGVGFNSIPQWLLPYNILSNGQQYRVNTARAIKSDTIFDEFTSVIDRNTAMSMCNSIKKLIQREQFTSIVFASPHRDVIEYLSPDWVYDTDSRILTINGNIYEMDSIKNQTFKKSKHFMKFSF